ncbi:hypothetical protein A2U01_0091615, partial [Trifolium medium]|nr:hypothetical protein [Trifolium medium]
KTWSVVIRCLEDKELMEIAKKEGRPGEAVVIILDISLMRRC